MSVQVNTIVGTYAERIALDVGLYANDQWFVQTDDVPEAEAGLYRLWLGGWIFDSELADRIIYEALSYVGLQRFNRDVCFNRNIIIGERYDASLGDGDIVVGWSEASIAPGTPPTNGVVAYISSRNFKIYDIDGNRSAFGVNTLLPGSLELSGDATPDQITANQNNYEPSVIYDALVLRLSSDAARSITGLQSGLFGTNADGRILILDNVGSYDLTLPSESASSTAANRFLFDADLTLAPKANAVIRYDSTLSRWRLVGMGHTLSSATVLASVFNGRLTLTSGTPVTTSDVTAATQIYLTPLTTGGDIYLYDGSNWVRYSLSEISIKITDTQNGNNANGSKVLSNLTDTSQFIVGMKVTGTGIAANSTIASIDSATQVTLNNNCTSDNTGVAFTFKVAASTGLDIFCYPNSGSPKLEMVAWTNSTTRATAYTTQNNILVKSGDATRRLVGSVYLTTTDGQTEHSRARRFVSNVYNRWPFELSSRVPVADWTVGTSVSQRACNTNTTEGQMRAPFFACLTDVAWDCLMVVHLSSGASDQRNLFAIGLNSTSATYGNAKRYCGVATFIAIRASGFPSTVGYNYLQMQESSQSGGGMTINGDVGGSLGGDPGLDAIVWM